MGIQWGTKLGSPCLWKVSRIVKEMDIIQIVTPNLWTCHCGKRDSAERGYKRKVYLSERDKEKLEVKYETWYEKGGMSRAEGMA